MKNRLVKLVSLALIVSLAVLGVACKGKKNPQKESPVVRKPSVGLEYELNEDGLSYTVVGIGSCEDKALVIPAQYNDLPVTAIGEDAFAFCDNLTSIYIGDYVTTIEDYAFCLCYNLTKIEVGKSNKAYQSISGNLYTKDGKKLIQYAIGKKGESFTVPSSVEIIGYMAFYDCDNLTSVNVGKAVTIEDRAFELCSNLSSVTIGDSAKTIGVRAFSSCDSLMSVKMGKNVAVIGDEAFYYCTSLTSINLISVKTIGKEAFYWCYSLEYVELGEKLTSIGEMAFEHCSGLMSVYYKGSADQWSNVKVGSKNERLTNIVQFI